MARYDNELDLLFSEANDEIDEIETKDVEGFEDADIASDFKSGDVKLSNSGDAAKEVSNATGISLEDAQFIVDCCEEFGVFDEDTGIYNEGNKPRFVDKAHKEKAMQLKQYFATRALVISTAKSKNDPLLDRYNKLQKQMREVYSRMNQKYGKNSIKAAKKMVKAYLAGNNAVANTSVKPKTKKI